MSANTALAERFELIGRLIEVLGEDPKGFRAAANAKAARILGDYPGDLAAMARGESAKVRLQEIEGVGPKIADKIMEFCTTGTIGELDELREKVPAGLLEVMQVPGLGPKTVNVLWKQGGVTDMASLKRVIADGSILSLPRMGEKSVQKIKESIAIAEEGQKRLHLGVAVPIAERIVELMKSVPGVERAAYAGSARRGKETVGDLDVLVSAKDAAKVSEAFRTMTGVTKVIVAGESKSSVRFAIGGDMGRYSLETAGFKAEDGPSIQVDLRVVPKESWGAALMYFTGSKEHNVRLRERAQQMGLTLNEYGLYPEDDEKNQSEPPQKRGVKAVAGKTEEEVFEALGLMWVPPEMREDRGEVEVFEKSKEGGKKAGKRGHHEAGQLASARGSFELVSVGDIVAELHAHTTASDGVMSIVQLAEMAKARGFHTIAVTDHSKSSAIANGLSVERLKAHIKAIHAARREVAGISILAGSEVDILADGSLDYDDELLAQLDVVVASPHTALSQDSLAATKRLLKAIEHPLVHILGHPTGRLINRRAGLAPEMGELIRAAVEHEVALEINAHWMRLDLRDVHVRQAVEAGALIAIDCDVHEPRDFDNLAFGVMTGRRGWLGKERCVNAWGSDKLLAWLGDKRG
jgi:DNA polymerase (family X)